MLREYGIGAQILRALGVQRAKLLSSTPKQIVGLASFGIFIESQELMENVVCSPLDSPDALERSEGLESERFWCPIYKVL
jgi:hypothetical protein